jgi:YD repeat-containing protein
MSRPLYDLKDVDGDGYPDIVQSSDDGSMTVTRSAIGRTNKLRTVYNPLGGSFTLDYQRSQATYDHPGGKWVLSSVTADDGVHDDGANMKTAFLYENGKQDRREREFLGFGTVITQDLNTEDSDKVYRSVIQSYDVSSVYTAGNELSSVTEDSTGNKYAESDNVYYFYQITAAGDTYAYNASAVCGDAAIAFTPLKYAQSTLYDGSATGAVANESFYDYYTTTGSFGDLKSYKYSDQGALGVDGTGAYNYVTSIIDTFNLSKYILSLPSHVTVTGGDGKTYRQTSATYDLNYADHLTNVTQTLNAAGDQASIDFVYDRFGNITQKTLPANSKGQRMWYKYLYDGKYNMYVTQIDDAFGYESNLNKYDYRYGVPLETRDMNGYYLETTIDDMGRVVSMQGPNEAAQGVPYTIKFIYPAPLALGKGVEGEAGAVARTEHYDPANPGDDIETATFVDGFGRAIQVKKDAEVSSAPGATAQKMQTVSGRIVYDPYGRVRAAYYPTTDLLTNDTVFSPTFDAVTPTTTTYDVLNRTLTTTLPDGSVTAMAYSIPSPAGDGSVEERLVTDALGHQAAAFTNGTGLTVRQEQYSGPADVITTKYFYDPINELLTVTDTKGNQTQSVYDLAGRRLSVTTPDNGTTRFTYDNASNLLTKQTANLKLAPSPSGEGRGEAITYDYDYDRLTGIDYPDHPENNVTYYYGSKNAQYNRVGRLMLQVDGSGAQEFYYGRQGELTKVVRTLIVPNQAIATYTMQWDYDTWNRLMDMTYPDNEKVSYHYNTGGQLVGVTGSKAYTYNYVQTIGYDKFEQRIYMKYCNGAETKYTYDSKRRRLANLQVIKNPKAGVSAAIMDDDYTYDAVSNILSISNKAPLPTGTLKGGQMTTQYSYDGLYRLTSATGNYKGANNKMATYNLAMTYDNLHNITSKVQTVTQSGVTFNGTLNAGYGLTYSYTNGTHQIDSLGDTSYRTENTDARVVVKKNSKYTYDANGNLIYVNTGRYKKDGSYDTTRDERKLLWDEENRLLAVDDNGFVSNYWYDAAGDRTVKTSGEGEGVFVLGKFSGGRTQTADFTLYVNPYMVVSKGGRYTKHIYIGSERIVSKLGDMGSYGPDPRSVPYAGVNTDVTTPVDYVAKYDTERAQIKARYKAFLVPDHGLDKAYTQGV